MGLGALSGLGDFCEPDALTPSQFYGDRTRPQLEGVRKLFLALLIDAIDCLQGVPCFLGGEQDRQPTTLRRLQREAKVWFVGEVTSSYAFSYENVCEVLGFEPSSFRQALFAKVRAAKLIDIPRKSPAPGETRVLRIAAQRKHRDHRLRHDQ